MEEKRIMVEKEDKEIKDKGRELQSVLFVIQRRISCSNIEKEAFCCSEIWKRERITLRKENVHSNLYFLLSFSLL